MKNLITISLFVVFVKIHKIKPFYWLKKDIYIFSKF